MSKITSLSAKDQGKTVFRLIKYTSPYKGIIALAFLMLTLATVTSMLTPYLIKVFIDDFLTPNNFPQ
ncbi:ABC transporter ATP-binding protein, partial [Staphylococcus arlettae]|nr:ABC transporter ATP-binding protein [Staphylococcus arlettae]